MAATVDEPAVTEPNDATFARVSVDEEKSEYSVAVVAFVAEITLPVIAFAMSDLTFAIPVKRFDDDAVFANDAVEVTPLAVTFWNELSPVNVLLEYVFGIVVDALT